MNGVRRHSSPWSGVSLLFYDRVSPLSWLYAYISSLRSWMVALNSKAVGKNQEVFIFGK